MKCNCKCGGGLLALVIIVFTLWTPAAWTKWLVVVSGVLILLHALLCRHCSCEVESKPKRKR